MYISLYSNLYMHIHTVYIYEYYVYILINVYVYIYLSINLYSIYTHTYMYIYLYSYLYQYSYLPLYLYLYRYRYLYLHEKEIIKLLFKFFLSRLLHFFVPGTGIRFRCRSTQMNMVPTGSGSSSAILTPVLFNMESHYSQHRL